MENISNLEKPWYDLSLATSRSVQNEYDRAFEDFYLQTAEKFVDKLISNKEWPNLVL